ncbi:unnamed protein product, partial [Iphiclides podalirius]
MTGSSGEKVQSQKIREGFRWRHVVGFERTWFRNARTSTERHGGGAACGQCVRIQYYMRTPPNTPPTNQSQRVPVHPFFRCASVEWWPVSILTKEVAYPTQAKNYGRG